MQAVKTLVGFQKLKQYWIQPRFVMGQVSINNSAFQNIQSYV